MSVHQADFLSTDSFKGATVIIPVIDETVSLEKTIEVVMKDSAADIVEIISVVCEKTKPANMAVVNSLTDLAIWLSFIIKNYRSWGRL